MATNTPNFNLKKPEQADFYNVDDFNGNMDILDDEVNKVKRDGKDHTEEVVTSDAGVHGTRIKDGSFQYFDGAHWVDVKSALPPATETSTSTNVRTATMAGLASYNDIVGTPIQIIANAIGNKGTATLNINGLGAKNIVFPQTNNVADPATTMSYNGWTRKGASYTVIYSPTRNAFVFSHFVPNVATAADYGMLKMATGYKTDGNDAALLQTQAHQMYTELKDSSVRKSANVITVGTTTAGHTADDCDYLCDGTNDEVEIKAAVIDFFINNPNETEVSVSFLNGAYNIQNVIVFGDGNANSYSAIYNVSLMGESKLGVKFNLSDAAITNLGNYQSVFGFYNLDLTGGTSTANGFKRVEICNITITTPVVGGANPVNNRIIEVKLGTYNDANNTSYNDAKPYRGAYIHDILFENIHMGSTGYLIYQNTQFTNAFDFMSSHVYDCDFVGINKLSNASGIYLAGGTFRDNTYNGCSFATEIRDVVFERNILSNMVANSTGHCIIVRNQSIVRGNIITISQRSSSYFANAIYLNNSNTSHCEVSDNVIYGYMDDVATPSTFFMNNGIAAYGNNNRIKNNYIVGFRSCGISVPTTYPTTGVEILDNYILLDGTFDGITLPIYSSTQYSIRIQGTAHKMALVTNNFTPGKAVTNESTATANGNTILQNKYRATTDFD